MSLPNLFIQVPGFAFLNLGIGVDSCVQNPECSLPSHTAPNFEFLGWPRTWSRIGAQWLLAGLKVGMQLACITCQALQKESLVSQKRKMRLTRVI